MRQRSGVVVATLWIAAAGVGCASTPPAHSSSAVEPQAPRERGPQLQGPDFDRQGADFTDWLADFEKKVHYNWKPPTYFGYGGAVEFLFTVERNGSISILDMLKSSGTEAMDRAARDALTRSQLAPLPAGFPPARVTMRITLHYNRPPGQ